MCSVASADGRCLLFFDPFVSVPAIPELYSLFLLYYGPEFLDSHLLT